MDEVTITMPALSAANTAIVLKSKLHDMQDLRERYPHSVYKDEGVFNSYLLALQAVNEVLPDEFKQIWIRT